MCSSSHSRGLEVLVYTVNKPEELLETAKRGVDGIFTDSANVLVDYL